MLQVDPYATKYASFSGYNYVGNNPVTFNDPSGGKLAPPPEYPQDACFACWEANMHLGGGYMGPSNQWTYGINSVSSNAAMMSPAEFRKFYGIIDSYGKVNYEKAAQVAQQAGEPFSGQIGTAVISHEGVNYAVSVSAVNGSIAISAGRGVENWDGAWSSSTQTINFFLGGGELQTFGEDLNDFGKGWRGPAIGLPTGPLVHKNSALAKEIWNSSRWVKGSSKYTSVASLYLRKTLGHIAPKAVKWLPKATSYGGQLGRFAGRTLWPVGVALTIYDVYSEFIQLENDPANFFKDWRDNTTTIGLYDNSSQERLGLD